LQPNIHSKIVEKTQYGLYKYSCPLWRKAKTEQTTRSKAKQNEQTNNKEEEEEEEEEEESKRGGIDAGGGFSELSAFESTSRCVGLDLVLDSD